MKRLSDLCEDLDLGGATGHAIASATGRVHFAWVRLSDIRVDPQYQRLVSRRGRAKIRRILRGFDWCHFGVLQVADCGDGTFALLDGQHRALAAWIGGAGTVPCMVASAERAEQARAFVGINTLRSSVAPIDKFRARVAAGDGDACVVDEILRDLQVSTEVAAGAALGPRKTRAVVQLEKLVKQIGPGLTYTAIEMLLEAQPEQENLLTAFAVTVTGMVLARVVEANGDIDRLAAVLADTDFETLADEAVQLVRLRGGRKYRHGADQLLHACNRRLRQRMA